MTGVFGPPGLRVAHRALTVAKIAIHGYLQLIKLLMCLAPVSG
jgi:hypothetical protein